MIFIPGRRIRIDVFDWKDAVPGNERRAGFPGAAFMLKATAR